DDERQAHVQRVDLLERITRAVGECTTTAAIYQTALSHLENAFGVDLALTGECEPHDGFVATTCIGPKSQPLAKQLALEEQSHIALNQDDLQRCLDGEVAYVPDLAKSEARLPERLARVDLRSLVAAPLIIEGKVVGALICARRAVDGFASSDREFLSLLAQHL